MLVTVLAAQRLYKYTARSKSCYHVIILHFSSNSGGDSTLRLVCASLRQLFTFPGELTVLVRELITAASTPQYRDPTTHH